MHLVMAVAQAVAETNSLASEQHAVRCNCFVWGLLCGKAQYHSVYGGMHRLQVLRARTRHLRALLHARLGNGCKW